MNRSVKAILAAGYETTPEDYLAGEREAFEKHEFIDGEIVAMAGASENHNLISSNLIVEIGGQLKNSKCRAFVSDMRVKALKNKKSNFYYPDVVIVCGERKYDDEKKDVLINPQVVIEVLSKSTQLKDRNEKLDSYLALESLTDYVLIEQDEIRIEHYSKIEAKTWKVNFLNEETQNLHFETAGCSVALKDIYNQVELKKIAQKRKSKSKSKVN